MVFDFGHWTLDFRLSSLILLRIVDIPKETTSPAAQPVESYAALEHGTSAAAPPVIDPNNPPWGLLAAVLTWVGSVVLLLGMNILITVPYIFYKFKGGSGESLKQFLLADKTAILLQILSTLPAHILTLGVAWAVVTSFGKRPFWQALGWNWTKRVGFWRSVGWAFGLYIVGIVLILLGGQQKTALEEIVASSRAASFSIAFLAVFTAPLVEEVVYRGVLYSALQKKIGMRWAIVGVLLLFTIVHVPQYWPNFGVIGAVGVLSLSLTLVRAYTGSLLPCFVMHLVFNGIQAVLIVLEPYLPKSITGGEKSAESLVMLARILHGLF
jgi:membrane protease YdiL (CAAX protease family)